MKNRLWISALIALIASELAGTDRGENTVRLDQPHTEPEIHPDWSTHRMPNPTVPDSPREMESYRLMLNVRYDSKSTGRIGTVKFSLVGTPLSQVPATQLQRMYGGFDSIEKLTSVLGKVLPRLQVRAVRRTLLAGKATEIGGHFGAVRVFSPQILRGIGMSFRPVDA